MIHLDKAEFWFGRFWNWYYLNYHMWLSLWPSLVNGSFAFVSRFFIANNLHWFNYAFIQQWHPVAQVKFQALNTNLVEFSIQFLNDMWKYWVRKHTYFIHNNNSMSLLSSLILLPIPQIELLLKSGDWLAANRSREDGNQGARGCGRHPVCASVGHLPCTRPSVLVTSGQHRAAPGGRCYHLPSTVEATEAS